MATPGINDIVRIQEGGLEHPAVIALVRQHLASAAEHSPPESVHALGLERLKQPGLRFYTAWQGDELAAMGAVKRLATDHAELKSMRTVDAFQRRGIAATMLRHLLQVAADMGCTRVSLETGSMDAFAPARALYARFGFVACAPFGDYREDPYSVCMTRML
ncbi:MAG: GNAT family N-acetyltransferase [Lysobacteraceae bacterium]|jgi:putative acetyltransferase|nr:GNAT family N-acetyltransferase [Silanimonas sp.]